MSSSRSRGASRGVSVQHAIIERANSNTVVTVAVAVFVSVFCIFAIRTLVSQMLFQNKVIDAKRDALNQLKENSDSISSLSSEYAVFDDEKINILNGNRDGKGPRDGRNAKIVMDSLPATLDIPAIASSFEKILVDGGYDVDTIGGSDKNTKSLASSFGSGQVHEVQYSFSVKGSTPQAESLMSRLESSIRPMYIDEISMSFGQGNGVETNYSVRTFYADEAAFNIGSREIK